MNKIRMNWKDVAMVLVACLAVCIIFFACKKQCKEGQVQDGKEGVDTTVDTLALFKTDSTNTLNAFRSSIKVARGDLPQNAQDLFDEVFAGGRDKYNSGSPQVDSVGGAKYTHTFCKVKMTLRQK